METVQLIVWIIVMSILSTIPILFLVFTRQGKNITTKIISRKKYVVCHLIRDETDFETIYNVVPKPDFYTTVGNFDYNLNPEYALMKFAGRLHYRLREKDSIPEYIKRDNSNKEILQQAGEITNSLHNRAYDFLYQKNKNLALLVCGVALAISLIIAIYAIYKIQQISPILTWLAEHPATIIQIPPK